MKLADFKKCDVLRADLCYTARQRTERVWVPMGSIQASVTVYASVEIIKLLLNMDFGQAGFFQGEPIIYLS